jgi:hypothetical protein
LPLPDSPSISTGNGERANCLSWARSFCSGRFADQPVIDFGGGVSKRQHPANQAAQVFRVGRFGDEFGRTQGARMARIEFVALAGQHHYAGCRRVGKDVRNQGEALVRAMGSRWQAKVDQRQRRCEFFPSRNSSTASARVEAVVTA